MKRIVSLMLVLLFLLGSISLPVFASTTDNMESEQQNMSNISVSKDNVTVTVQQDEPIKDNVFVDIPITDSASSRNDSVIKQDIVGSGYEDFYATMTTSLTYMDDKTAESFIGFIYNVKTSNVNNEMKSTNDLFNYLTGRLTKASQEYEYAQVAFILTASKLINYHVSSSEKMFEITTDNLISLLSKQVGGSGNLADEIVNQELGKIKKSVKKILGCLAETDDLILYIDSVMSAYNSVVGAPGKVEAFLEGLDIAVNACNYVFASNNMKAYNYYLTYLNNRDLETGSTANMGILPLIMDTYNIGNISELDGISIFLQSIGFGNSWTSGDVQRYLRIFAEFTYHSINEINNSASSGGGYVEPETEVTSISFSRDTYEFNTNQIQHTYALVYPSSAIDSYLTFYSSNTSVATVESTDGVTCRITSVAPGTCYIYAEASNGVTGKCKVTIVPVLPEKIEFSESEYEIFFNQNIVNPVSIYPSYTYDKNLKYYSGDTSVAKIDSNGKVTAVSPGEVTIYAEACNGIVDSYKLKILPYTASLNDDDTYNIVRYVGKEKNVIIPSTIHGERITTIGEKAFEGDKNITKVIISNSIVHIGTKAFRNCTALTDISLPDSITTISEGMLNSCTSLKNVTIPNSITHINDFAFDSCTSLEKIVIPNSVVYIGVNAFSYCDALTDVSMSNSITTINASLFNSCISLTNIIIPNSVTSIGESAFEYCCSLESIYIPSSVIEIGEMAFYFCYSLTHVDISRGVTDIGEHAFSYSGLLEINIPSSVTCIGDVAFTGCSSLQNIFVDNENQYYSDIEGVLFDKNISRLFKYPSKNKSTHYSIPDSVTEICEGAFEDSDLLKSVNIPESVISIGDFAFEYCYALKDVEVPGSTISIGAYAFFECSSLTSIIIPESVQSIGDRAFGCYDYVEGGYIMNIHIKCYRNSYAYDYAVSNGIPYEIIHICSFANYIFDNNATCVEDGTKTAYCDNGCGATDTIVVIGSATGHSWGNWFQTIVPTITSTGEETRTCTVCDEIETKEIPMLTIVPEISTDNYVVSITNAEYIKDLRYAPGVYATTTQIRNAEGNVALDNGVVTANTVDGKFIYEMPKGGYYTIWIRMIDGTNYILPLDVTNFTPTVSADGVTVTIHNLYDVKDFFIAKGEFKTYREIKDNGYIFSATGTKIGTKHDYTYTVYEPGVHTILIRYNDGSTALFHETLTVDEPVFTTNGLQVVISNIPDVKVIRTAYGKWNSTKELKATDTIRNFSAKTAIKGSDPYKIQYREEGMVTIIVEYNNGYVKVFHYDVQQKEPTVEQNGNTVTIGDLDELNVIRYAKGEYTTSTQIKNASGSKALKSGDIVDGSIVVTLDPGTYTFCVQYDDESYNYYIVVID